MLGLKMLQSGIDRSILFKKGLKKQEIAFQQVSFSKLSGGAFIPPGPNQPKNSCLWGK